MEWNEKVAAAALCLSVFEVLLWLALDFWIASVMDKITMRSRDGDLNLNLVAKDGES